MQQSIEINQNPKLFSRDYWRLASRQLGDVRMITIAALIVALRVAVKFFKINIASGLGFSLDGYVNSLGSMIYGPVLGLLVGAISDILGLVVTCQMGQFFPPFTLVEMTSSFIFALFFWRRKISVTSALTAKFSVNLVCNILMTSIFMKWLKFLQGGQAAADAYQIINGVRIAKNLIMFPLEAMIIIMVLSFALPILTRLKLVDKKLCFIEKTSTKSLIIKVALFTVISIAIVVAYFLLDESVDFKYVFNVSKPDYSHFFEQFSEFWTNFKKLFK